MSFDKRDIVPVVLLTALFLLLAMAGLGSARTPRTTFTPTEPTSITLDLGQPRRVAAARLLVKRGKGILRIAGATDPASEVEIPSVYYTWSDALAVERDSRFLRLELVPDPQEGIEAAELALIGVAGELVIPAAVASGDSLVGAPGWSGLAGPGRSPGELPRPPIHALIDEQDLVRLPIRFTEESCFDERYYVRAAEDYLRLAAPYEWTHPPLGKLILAFGIGVLGFGPFGWRMPGVLFAALMIPAIYALAKRAIGSRMGATATAFLLTFDFMHFVLARTGTIDTFLVLFALLSQLCFFHYFALALRDGWNTSARPLFAATAFAGMALATKWLALYGLAGMLLLMLFLRLRSGPGTQPNSGRWRTWTTRPLALLPACGAIVVVIYGATYVPNLLAGKTPAQLVGLQLEMYRYHTGMTATHPFSSAWWSWPLMLRPIWVYVEELPGGLKSTVALLGNPAVWWGGLAPMVAVLIAAARALRRPLASWSTPELAAVFCGTAFLSQWLPYALLSRVTFLFHFYACVPYLCLAGGWAVDRLWKTKRGRIAAVAFLALAAALFALFHPALSGAPAADSAIERLKWLGADRWEF